MASSGTAQAEEGKDSVSAAKPGDGRLWTGGRVAQSGAAAVLLAVLWLGLWLGTPAIAHAEGSNGITAPAAGSAVAGLVTVQGVADHPTFRKWQLDLLINGDDRQARFLAVSEKPVSAAGVLATFDSTTFPDGEHKLRLRVVYLGLNYDEFFTPITISNSGAAPAASADPASPAAEPTPEPVVFRTDAPPDGKRWIEVDIGHQTLTAWQGDVPVFHTSVSTGKPGYRTLPGTFHVYVKYEQTRMVGADYDTPDVPWTMYYYRGFALHGAYWHNNFGTPVSHGCVNLRVPEAKALFEWASVGTEVVVHE